MKILYAAGNYESSKTQLERFVDSLDPRFTLKIAAYKKSSPPINIDYNLDSFSFNDNIEYSSDNLYLLMKQIESFEPDLIISDMEYYCSFIAKELKILLWQCSAFILNNSLTSSFKHSLGLNKTYEFLLREDYRLNQKIVNVLDNSDKIFVYSHFGDLSPYVDIKNGFDWIRPYFQSR